MIFGVLSETAPGETRAALTPTRVREVAGLGVRVVLERGVGTAAGFRDEWYLAAGARLVDSASEVFSCSDVVGWVKPPVYSLDAMPLRAGTTVVGFMDPFKAEARLAALRRRGILVFAFEFVPRGEATRDIDALSSMSRIAGAVAYEQARGMAVPYCRQPLRSLVLGCGEAGLAAARAALAHGDTPFVAGTREAHRRLVHTSRLGHYVSLRNGDDLPAVLRHITPDLVICAAVRRAAPAPCLLGSDELATLRPGVVVVDLAANAGGNCIATRPDHTLTTDSGVIITHRSNYPALRPVEATHAYADAVVGFIRRRLSAHPGTHRGPVR